VEVYLRLERVRHVASTMPLAFLVSSIVMVL
jgi:hypothetical protein